MEHQPVCRLLIAALSGRSMLLWGCFAACPEDERVAVASDLHRYIVENGYQWPDGNHDLRLEALEFLSEVIANASDASSIQCARDARTLAGYLQVHLERVDTPLLELADAL